MFSVLCRDDEGYTWVMRVSAYSAQEALWAAQDQLGPNDAAIRVL